MDTRITISPLTQPQPIPMSIRQSVVLPMFKSEDAADLGAFLDEIKTIGFSAVEIWNRGPSFETIVELARSRDLRIASMVGHEHASPTAGTHAEGFSRRRNHDRLEAELRESIDLAVRHDIPGLITLSGHRNPDESDEETRRVCAEGL